MSELNWKLFRRGPELGAGTVLASTMPRFYWRVTPLAGESWALNIGVNQAEIAPRFLETGRTLFIGVEQGVFALDRQTGEVLSAVNDTSYVQAIETAGDGLVVVSGETELMAFSATSGALLWRTELPDAVETFEQVDGRLEIRGVEGTMFELNLTTGKAHRR